MKYTALQDLRQGLAQCLGSFSRENASSVSGVLNQSHEVMLTQETTKTIIAGLHLEKYEQVVALVDYLFDECESYRLEILKRIVPEFVKLLKTHGEIEPVLSLIWRWHTELANDHIVSTVIEPVVMTITSDLKLIFPAITAHLNRRKELLSMFTELQNTLEDFSVDAECVLAQSEACLEIIIPTEVTPDSDCEIIDEFDTEPDTSNLLFSVNVADPKDAVNDSNRAVWHALKDQVLEYQRIILPTLEEWETLITSASAISDQELVGKMPVLKIATIRSRGDDIMSKAKDLGIEVKPKDKTTGAKRQRLL